MDFLYHLRWGERKTLKKPKICSKCSRTLTFKDRKTRFGMDEGFDSDLHQFQKINQALKATGLSYCTLRNACEKGNMTSQDEKMEKSSICTGWVCVLIV